MTQVHQHVVGIVALDGAELASPPTKSSGLSLMSSQFHGPITAESPSLATVQHRSLAGQYAGTLSWGRARW